MGILKLTIWVIGVINLLPESPTMENQIEKSMEN